MHAGELPTFVCNAWLLELTTHAVDIGACVSWGCTTCGAMPFRHALIESARTELGASPTDHELSREIAARLRDLPDGPEFIEATRFVLMFLYVRSGSNIFENDLIPLFVRSPAEREYKAMAEHHARIMEQRHAHEMRNDPEGIARGKAFKEAEKQERFARRAVRKAEIDRAWRERRVLQSRSKDR